MTRKSGDDDEEIADKARRKWRTERATTTAAVDVVGEDNKDMPSKQATSGKAAAPEATDTREMVHFALFRLWRCVLPLPLATHRRSLSIRTHTYFIHGGCCFEPAKRTSGMRR